jgi:hypothetical protein
MENAHLRLGLLEYVRITEKTSTRIRLRVDRYIGEDRQAHLLSVFGNDSDVGAITAAVHEKGTFSLTFPDGTMKDVSLGEHASCYKGAVMLPGGSIQSATWWPYLRNCTPMELAEGRFCCATGARKHGPRS